MASGLRQRVITAIIIGIPIIAMLLYSDFSRVLLLLLIGVFAGLEYLNLNYKVFYKKPQAILSILLLFVVYYYSIKSADLIYHWVLGICILSSCMLLYNLFYQKTNIHTSAPWLWHMLYVGLPIACLLCFSSNTYFSGVMISILFMVWISDIAAYFIGSTIGKRKLFPEVSPGKTWEGFLGAGLVSVLFSYAFASYFQFFDIRAWAIVALCVWFFGALGDLVESKLKRQLAIKDSGNIMPGHGGFLDRFDAFIFCIPFVLLFIELYQNI